MRSTLGFQFCQHDDLIELSAPCFLIFMKNKVPQVTVAFWIIKIAATTLGETGGDALSMMLNRIIGG